MHSKHLKRKKENSFLLRPNFFLTRVCVCVKVAQSCLTLCDPMDYSCRAPLSMEFSRQEYWSVLPFPSILHLLSL